MPVDTTIFVFVALSSLAGLAAGIAWPYVNAWFTTTDPDFKFNLRMVAGRVLGGVVGFLISASALTQIQELATLVNQYQWLGYILSFFTMFGYAYLGREAQKTGGIVMNKVLKR